METAVAASGYKFPSRASHSESLRSYPPSPQLRRGKQLLSSCVVSGLWYRV